MNVNDTHKVHFDDNGFVLIKDFFSVDEADTIVSYANEIEGWNEEKFKWMIYYEQNTSGEKRKARIEHFINYHDNLNTLLRNKLMPVVDYIYGEEVNLFKDKMNWKYGKGKGFKPHQDHPAWTDFAPKKYVSMALFANNTTVDNGCLQFVYGHHLNGIYDYDKDGTGEINKEYQTTMEWKHITTTPRDLLLFDSYAPHKSDENKTSDSRRIFYFTFNSKKEGDHYVDYFKRKRQELPPENERTEDTNINIQGNKYNLANPIV